MFRTRTGRWATSVVLALVAGSLAAPPATAAVRVTPGSFTGFAFDTCDTPDSAAMDVWRETSPFWGVGVYLGGEATTCDTTNLTQGWVSRQAKRGWRILPLWVGPQAECSTVPYAADIDSSPADSYAAAARQGRVNANAAVRRAKDLGIRAGSTLWYDIEDFGLSDDDCRRSTLTFLSAWTKRLRALDYVSGVYSNVSAAIDALDYADTVSPGSYAMPDQIWYAWDNGRADTYIADRWVRDGNWTPRRRIHQYALDTVVEHGGVTMKIDRNFMALGRGSVAPKALPTCGVKVDFADYKRIRRGATGGQVKAAQCLLQKKRFYGGAVHGRYDGATVRAVRAFQRSRALRVTGTMTAPTWTALLGDGKAILVKRGSVGDPVRRTQRGLTAALDRKVAVTGVFDAGTTKAVAGYQRRLGLTPTGVMDAVTWAELKAGHR
jgi:hypothetical protein